MKKSSGSFRGSLGIERSGLFKDTRPRLDDSTERRASIVDFIDASEVRLRRAHKLHLPNDASYAPL